jgi:predicted phosphoribosyltransferase
MFFYRNDYVFRHTEHLLMGVIIENPKLRDRHFVFTSRHNAGRQLGEFLKKRPGITVPIVCAIPAGGVPVGIEIAHTLRAPLTLIIVRKVQIPGNTEAGFGAVTWDGQVVLNERLLTLLNLSDSEVQEAIATTQKNVTNRINRFLSGRNFPDLAGATVILTDDGLASGFTMLAAIKSVRNKRPAKIIVAVPTAPVSSASLIAKQVDELICLNICTGFRFAVAEAYQHWYDLSDKEVLDELATVQNKL